MRPGTGVGSSWDCPASLGFSVVLAALLRGEAEGLRPLAG